MILSPIGSGFKAAPSAALSVFRCVADGMPLEIATAYRDSTYQRRLYNAWLAYRRYLNGGPWAPHANFALPPGTSMHELGLAIDFGAASVAWLLRHGNAHGWFQTNPEEDWHWEYQAPRDQYRNTTTTPVVVTNPPEDDDMRYFTTGGQGAAIYELGPAGSWIHVTADQWQAIGSPRPEIVTPAELTAIASLAAARRGSLG